MQVKKYSLILVFLFLVVISPWVATFARNFHQLDPIHERLLVMGNVTEEVNLLQNQARDNELGIEGKIIVNKYTFFAKDIIQRYFESYDGTFLFVKGDLDFKKSTGGAGALYLTYLPLVLVGFVIFLKKEKNKYKKTVLWLLFLAPLPASIIYVHYETIFRIPFLILLTFFAAYGLLEIVKKHKKIAFILLIFLIIEVTNFYHDLAFHYVGRMAREGYLQQQ